MEGRGAKGEGGVKIPNVWRGVESKTRDVRRGWRGGGDRIGTFHIEMAGQ